MRKPFYNDPGYYIEMAFSDIRNDERLRRAYEAKKNGNFACTICMGSSAFRDGLCKHCYFGKDFRSGKHANKIRSIRSDILEQTQQSRAK